MNGFIGLRLPKPIENALKRKCENEDNSISNFVRGLILNAMDNSND